MDITELILTQHHEQRRTFALLDELADDPAGLAAVWERLTILLEVHAEAEEKFFYPRLLEVGTGGGDADERRRARPRTPSRTTTRSGTRSPRPRGTRSVPTAWWTAVRRADEANSDHMAEEEREDLVDFRRHADLQTRHEIAVQFIVYENQHAARGITPKDQDPDTYVAEHS